MCTSSDVHALCACHVSGLERSYAKYLGMAVSGISKPKLFNFKQVSGMMWDAHADAM